MKRGQEVPNSSWSFSPLERPTRGVILRQAMPESESETSEVALMTSIFQTYLSQFSSVSS